MTSSIDWLGLSDLVCVVTGAGSGIGAETARQFALAGARVAVVDRDAAAAGAVVSDIVRSNGRAIGVEADVSDADAMRAAAERVQSELGVCRILVNNAAMRHREPLLGLRVESWNQVLAVNLFGPLLCTQLFSAQMIAAGGGGSIVHVGSLLGHHPQVDGSAYCASKAALGMLSRSMALELAPHGIRSNMVSPGFTRTPANEASYRDPETAAARASLIPSGRAALPSDVADVIVMLSSERSRYVNGADIVVDGGVGCTLMGKVPRPTH